MADAHWRGLERDATTGSREDWLRLMAERARQGDEDAKHHLRLSEAGRIADLLGPGACRSNPIVHACLRQIVDNGITPEEALVWMVKALAEASDRIIRDVQQHRVSTFFVRPLIVRPTEEQEL